ncbi:hypothetical protein A2U01_0013157, partial [Trifolium medium]|nr:hypothetical protein [Trifolium medium]
FGWRRGASLSCGPGAALTPLFLSSSPGLPSKWYQNRGSAWWGTGVDPGTMYGKNVVYIREVTH